MAIMGFKKGKSPKKRKVPVRTLKHKCDKLWSEVIRQVGACEICGATKNLNAHHLIGKTGGATKYRYDLSNGLCLCVNHHKFDPQISGHASTAASYALMEWLREHRFGQYLWAMAAKDDKRFEKLDYERIYAELSEMVK